MIYKDKVTTIAGTGQRGFQDGNALNSMFHGPTEICISNDGRIYISDYFNNRIRMIYNNQVTTVAGNGQKGFRNGDALNSMFNGPIGICCSEDGRIYITDHSNNRIRMVYNNKVTTVAGNGQRGFQDGNALNSMFDGPNGICYSNCGKIYVSEYHNHRIRMIYNNQVTTIAGNGQRGFQDGNALEAKFNSPYGIYCSKEGKIYVSDYVNHRIRMIYGNQVTTIAGNGQSGFQDGNALEAMFDGPYGVCCSREGRMYISDSNNHTIRMIYNNQHPANLQKSLFSFALLLDMQNTFCDCQISLNSVIYQLHGAFVNVRCPLLFDQSYFSLIQQSNISNKSFESFLNFLYSNRLTKEHHQTLPTISIESIVDLIFIFDLLMNCKWILNNLKTRFEKDLIDILNINQDESVKTLMLELLPSMYNMKELIKTKSIKSNITTTTATTTIISYTEYCYNMLIHELQKKRTIVTLHLLNLQQKMTNEAFVNVVAAIIPVSEEKIESFDDQSMIVFGAELTDLCELAFEKTNIVVPDRTVTKLESTSISTKHLNEWTRPDFVIKLSNGDDDDISYHVHKLILCGRWKYFCLMIESGLKEVNENQMTLSDDWNKSRIEKMIKYIYLNEVDFDELEDVAWLMKNRRLYGIAVQISHKNDNNLVAMDEIDDEIAADGFEALYEHCVRILRQPLTLSNCISLYLMFEQIGIESLIQEALIFITNNFLSLLKDPRACTEIRNIQNNEKLLRLFIAYLDKNKINN